MDSIFHEKQQGRLCAMHCLNALLQGAYFTAPDLAALATQLDEQERHTMAEAGLQTAEYRSFVQQGSQNMDDSGYFSVQVLSAALRVWSLELVPYSSRRPEAALARAEPSRQKAFICNYQDHWMAIRRLGKQWFNLNSMLSSPQLLSDLYLTEFLAQLQQEGYTVFLVLGILPACPADEILERTPVGRYSAGRHPAAVSPSSGSSSSQLRPSSSATDQDEEQLQRAIAASLQPTESQAAAPSDPTREQLRQLRQGFLRRVQQQEDGEDSSHVDKSSR